MKRIFYIAWVLLFACSEDTSNIKSDQSIYSDSELKATEDSALVTIELIDYPLFEKPHQIVVTLVDNGVEYKTHSNDINKAAFLIPRVHSEYYQIKVFTGDKVIKYDRKFKIPQDQGAYDLNVKLEYSRDLASQYVQ
ncbi:MAG: hypothetical protein MRY83_08145 [Flavobacteriales bacterium]|nr:hypothetical protein [Flavobacteriales bacterium]